MNCPLCRGSSVRRFPKHGIWIRDCRACGHRFAELTEPTNHIEKTYADEYFFGGGAGYSDYLAEAGLLKARGRSYARRVRGRVRTGSLLDVGAAAGFFLQGWVESGWRGVGVEPNARMAEYARTELGIPVEQGTLETLRLPEPVDLVCFSQVIAHFIDPLAALEQAARLTKPAGYWLIETWDRASLTARVAGASWHEYSPPSVLHWFTRAGLRRLAGRFGFHAIASGRTVKWLQVAHARSLLGHSSSGSPVGRLARMVLGLLPQERALPYPSEDLFWMLFRREPNVPALSNKIGAVIQGNSSENDGSL